MKYRIRPCTPADTGVIDAIINDAAIAYKGVIPDDCWHEPYMSRSELEAEIDAGVQFWAWDNGSEILGVMGIQAVKDVTLIRHAYVRTAHQGRGIGGALLDSLTSEASTALLVGTWADAAWAIRLYERHGFRLVDQVEKDRLLDCYWTISPRQRDTSVVLKFEGH